MSANPEPTKKARGDQNIAVRMKSVVRGTRYHSVLNPHEDFIRAALEADETFKVIAERLLAEKNLKIAPSSISAFVRARSKRKGRAKLPKKDQETAPFPIVEFFYQLYNSGLDPQKAMNALNAIMPLVRDGIPVSGSDVTPDAGSGSKTKQDASEPPAAPRLNLSDLSGLGLKPKPAPAPTTDLASDEEKVTATLEKETS